MAKMTRIEQLRGIIEGSTASKIDGYLVDLFTAGMLVTVYEALSPENQAKFDDIPLARLVDFGWKQVKPA